MLIGGQTSMKKLILSLIWLAVATMATSNAQQALPGQTAATQQVSKPNATGARDVPQRRLQPTQSATGSNNPSCDEGVANATGHRKPAVNNSGGGKLAVNIPGHGSAIERTSGASGLRITITTITRTLCAGTGMNGMTAIGGNNTL
jgi:hypothetical protein